VAQLLLHMLQKVREQSSCAWPAVSRFKQTWPLQKDLQHACTVTLFSQSLGLIAATAGTLYQFLRW